MWSTRRTMLPMTSSCGCAAISSWPVSLIELISHETSRTAV